MNKNPKVVDSDLIKSIIKSSYCEKDFSRSVQRKNICPATENNSKTNSAKTD